MKRIIQVDHGKVRFYTNVKKIFFLILVLAGCQSGNKESGQTKELPVIDISKNYPEKTIMLQDVADIEYIPLETTDDVLLNQYCQISYISDKYIIVYESLLSNDIFVFDRKGKIISHFNRKGQGGEEYSAIWPGGVVFDDKTEEIFVFAPDRIVVYSLNGKFIRKITPTDLNINRAFSFDDESLLVYFEDYRKLLENTTENPNRLISPYRLISKKDGSLIAVLNVNLPVIYSYMVSIPIEFADGQMGTSAAKIDVLYNMQYGDDYVIADRSSDTIYRLTSKRELTPILVRKPSVHSSEPRTIWTSYFTTEKFILLQTYILDLKALEKNIKKEPVTLIHDFETGETNRVKFNDVELFSTMWLPAGVIVGPCDLPKNTTAILLEPSLLKRFEKGNLLKGMLKELVSNLDEDDNPVVAIYKFK